MKALKVDYTMTLEFSGNVLDHYFLLRCVPVSRGCQTVLSRSLTVNPDVPLAMYRDVFGNVAYRGQCYAPHGMFSFQTEATVQVHAETGSHESCLPLYKYNTPLTLCSDEMRSFLYDSFGSTEFAQAVKERRLERSQIPAFTEKLRQLVYSHITYVSGSTSVRTSASEAFQLRKGVCQDYAHLFCSLSREAGVPARYICGMSKGEGATHAWAEVFVPEEDFIRYDGTPQPGRWYGIDPTRNKNVDDDYVILGIGREFSDCQVDRGVFCGAVSQKQTVSVKTSELAMADNMGSFTGHAVSSSSNLEGQQQQ